MQTIRVTAILITLCFVLTGHAMGQTGDRFENVCPSLKNAVSADLLQFLNGVTPDKENAWCVTWAIRKMGLEQYEPAVVVLVRLLDFRRPPTENEARGFYLRAQSTDEVFPAALALELIGKPALPEVLRTIEADSTSVTARENAVWVWMEAHKYERPKGVALLKQEESKANQDQVKRRLRGAVERALKYQKIRSIRPNEKWMLFVCLSTGSSTKRKHIYPWLELATTIAPVVADEFVVRSQPER